METYTLSLIKNTIEAYAQCLQDIDAEDEKGYNAVTDEMTAKVVECFGMMRDMNPELVQTNMWDFIGKEEANRLKETLRNNAGQRYALNFIPSGQCAEDRVGDTKFFTPTYLRWQDENNARQNFVIDYDDRHSKEAKDALNSILLNVLLGLPVKYVRLDIIDFNLTGLADWVTTQLEPTLYNGAILVREEEVRKRFRQLVEQMAVVMGRYGNLAAYNSRHKEIVTPYEIVVLNCYPNNYDSFLKELLPLFENGPRCGIYFIVMNNTDYSLLNTTERHLLQTDNYQTIDLPDLDTYSKGLVNFTPIHRNPLVADVCFDYLREEVNRKPKSEVLKQEFEKICNKQYESSLTEISVTVGIDINTREKVTLRFNSGDYIHAFILGQSGSGKSVLLNNIITTAINKYAPEDLMLYLLDFKGVEFNRYRGIKHAKAVLVDNSDPQMTLEVLRALKEENRRRVKLWQSDSVSNIDGYNKKHYDKRLPQILFVADECQVMFSKVNMGQGSYVIQREIGDIVNTIATQGRSQGIHMLLATQQLDETDISGQVLKNLTECFILMSSPADSERLVPDSSEMTAKQPTGQCCYYHKQELHAQVRTFYANDEELEAAIRASELKAIDSKGHGGHYFNGSSTYWFDRNELATLMASGHKSLTASIGRNVGLGNIQTQIVLQRDYSENILFFGANKEEQTVGVEINALMSLIISSRLVQTRQEVFVIDCIKNFDSKYRHLIEAMEECGYCKLVERNESGSLFRRLADEIRNQEAKPTILAIIGNEHFAEIKRNLLLEQVNGQTNDIMGDINMDNLFGGSELTVKTFQDAIQYILDEGPMQGVHTLLQVDKPSNILFEGEYGKNATDKFRHKVILRSENKHLTIMNFSVELDVETLGDEEEHFRAYYYPEDGTPEMFTPFVMPTSIDIINEK